MVSTFESWGEKPGRRRLTRPRRERVRVKEKRSPIREDYARYRDVFHLIGCFVDNDFGKRIF